MLLPTGAAPEVILASNTSSISITRLAATTDRPDRVSSSSSSGDCRQRLCLGAAVPV